MCARKSQKHGVSKYYIVIQNVVTYHHMSHTSHRITASHYDTYNNVLPHTTMAKATMYYLIPTGHSESLFSGKCISDEECNGLWVIPLMLVSAVLYTLFLIFQRDLRKRVSPITDIKVCYLFIIICIVIFIIYCLLNIQILICIHI